MAYDRMDLSGWDPRTLEIAEKYGLSTFRLDSWMRTYSDPRNVELEYLRHTGQKVFLVSLDQRDPNSSGYGTKTAIETTKKAKKIFELFLELDNTQARGRKEFISDRLENCDLYLDAMRE